MVVRAAIVASFLVACGSGGGFPDAKPPDTQIPGGRFTLSWTVQDMNGAAVSCNRIGSQSVTVLLHKHGVLGGSTEAFVCSTGMGESQAFAPGEYDMMFELGGMFGTVATAPPQGGIFIESGSTTPLAPLAFMVDAKGGLNLKLNTNKSGGNCAPAAMMGGGITATTITLDHVTGGACEAVTFDIAAGMSQPASAYTVNCAAPVDGPCIENDQAITVMGVPSDNYTIHIRGKVGAATCWSNNDQLQVPPAGMPLTRTLNLGYATGTPGC